MDSKRKRKKTFNQGQESVGFGIGSQTEGVKQEFLTFPTLPFLSPLYFLFSPLLLSMPSVISNSSVYSSRRRPVGSPTSVPPEIRAAAPRKPFLRYTLEHDILDTVLITIAPLLALVAFLVHHVPFYPEGPYFGLSVEPA